MRTASRSLRWAIPAGEMTPSVSWSPRHYGGLLPQDVPVLFDSGDVLSLLDLWSDCDALVCVDA